MWCEARHSFLSYKTDRFFFQAELVPTVIQFETDKEMHANFRD